MTYDLRPQRLDSFPPSGPPARGLRGMGPGDKFVDFVKKILAQGPWRKWL